jgi:ATP-dependent protease HslVU (ClpYQ) ATPase subunit
VKIKISKRDGLYIGSVGLDVENAPGRITMTAVAKTKAAALAKAATLAERIASDPVVRSLIPPQAMASIKVAKGLAAAARHGLPTLRRAFRFLSPKAKTLAAHLASDVAKGQIGDVGWNPFRRKKKKRPVRKPDRELETEADNSDDSEDGAE